MKRLILCLALLGLLGCNKQPSLSTQPTAHIEEIRTMVIGIDQYADENALGLNTGHGPFVVGPEVDAAQKTQLHEAITEAHEYVVTIRYVKMPATKNRVAHRRVISMVILDREYILVR